MPDIQFAFSRLGHIYSCNLSNPNTYEAPNVHNPYFSTSDVNQMFTKATTNFSVFHSLVKIFYKLQGFVSMLNKAPSCFAVSETWSNSESAVGTIQLQNYTFIHKPSSTRADGVGVYIQICSNYSVCHDICMPSSNCESLWVKIETNSGKFIYLGVIYRHPNQHFDDFKKDLNGVLTNFNLNNNEYIITGDLNIDLLESTSDNKVGRYDQNLESLGCKPLNTAPTRFSSTVSPSLLDHIYCKLRNTKQIAGIAIFDVSDHLPISLWLSTSINRKSEKQIIR